MTDHRHPEIRVPVITDLEGREVRVLYADVADYRIGDEHRRLVLADFPWLGLTLFDVCAVTGGDQHIADDCLQNLDEAGRAADAHVRASIALGRPAAETAEKPTQAQLHWFRRHAPDGSAREVPRSRAEARKQMCRARPGAGPRFDVARAARDVWEARSAGAPR
ncbi:MAG TPA: hypothetical protein VF549_08370 [Solirubrobacteraceae bacterium]|jgi:hypothetical protein